MNCFVGQFYSVDHGTDGVKVQDYVVQDVAESE